MASDDAEEAALRALPVNLDELADLLEGGDDVRYGLVDLQTGVAYPYSEMSGEYLGLGEGFDPDEDPDRWLVVRMASGRGLHAHRAIGASRRRWSS